MTYQIWINIFLAVMLYLNFSRKPQGCIKIEEFIDLSERFNKLCQIVQDIQNQFGTVNDSLKSAEEAINSQFKQQDGFNKAVAEEVTNMKANLDNTRVIVNNVAQNIDKALELIEGAVEESGEEK